MVAGSIDIGDFLYARSTNFREATFTLHHEWQLSNRSSRTPASGASKEPWDDSNRAGGAASTIYDKYVAHVLSQDRSQWG
jgi:hypothetical protein